MKQATKPKFSLYISIRVKMLVAFTGLFAIIFGAAFIWFDAFGTQLALDNVANQLKSTAETIARNINGDDYQALAQVKVDTLDKTQKYWGITDPRYRQLADSLATYKQMNGTVTDLSGAVTPRVSLYTYIATDVPGTIEYIGSAGAVNTPPTGAQFHEVYKTKPPDPTRPTENNNMWQGLSQTMVNVTKAVSDQYGTWFSGFAPIHNSTGDIVGAVGVDLRDTTVVALKNQIRNAVVPAFLVTFVILFVLVYAISFGISRPIAVVTRRAKRVAEGDYTEEKLSKPLASFINSVRDETAVLNDVFGIMVEKVRQREETLISQVQELKIEIDQAKKDKQVGEIVESEFFKDLQTKARTMRGRSHVPMPSVIASSSDTATDGNRGKADDTVAAKTGDQPSETAATTSPLPQKDSSA